jgi:DNA-binding transcriptional LysR family regulator
LTVSNVATISMTAAPATEPEAVIDQRPQSGDLAVRIARLRSSSLVSRQLSSTRLVLYASSRYLLKRGTPQHPEELAHHDVLAYSLLAMGDTCEFTGPDGLVSVRVKPRLRTNSGDTCRAVALRHQGIILQPTFMVQEDLRSGALVEVLPGYRSVELGIYAVYPTRKHVLPKV